MHYPRRAVGFGAAFLLARRLDLIIVPGTGILDDFNENPFGWPFTMLRWSLAAKLAGTRLAFVSIGAGPVRHPLSRFFIRQASSLSPFRSYRDQVSHDFMKGLGVDSGGISSARTSPSPCRPPRKASLMKTGLAKASASASA